jgi:hypothetical protein
MYVRSLTIVALVGLSSLLAIDAHAQPAPVDCKETTTDDPEPGERCFQVTKNLIRCYVPYKGDTSTLKQQMERFCLYIRLSDSDDKKNPLCKSLILKDGTKIDCDLPKGVTGDNTTSKDSVIQDDVMSVLGL